MKQPIPVREPVAREDVGAPDEPPITAEGSGTCNTQVVDMLGHVYWQGVVTTKGMTREQRAAYRAALDLSQQANEKIRAEHPELVTAEVATAAQLAEASRSARVKREPDPAWGASKDARYGPLREIVKTVVNGAHSILTLGECGHTVKVKTERSKRNNTRCRKCRGSASPSVKPKREPIPRDDTEPEPARAKREPIARVEEFVARGAAAQRAVDAAIPSTVQPVTVKADVESIEKARPRVPKKTRAKKTTKRPVKAARRKPTTKRKGKRR